MVFFALVHYILDLEVAKLINFGGRKATHASKSHKATINAASAHLLTNQTIQRIEIAMVEYLTFLIEVDIIKIWKCGMSFTINFRSSHILSIQLSSFPD